MEEYLDLKFTGDLAFLNDSLTSTTISLQEEKREVIINKPVTNNAESVTPNPLTSIENMEKFNGTMNGQDTMTKENYSTKKMDSGMTNYKAPLHNSEKSRLEEMILKGGYELEVINSKIEMIELEKEKIIMKYKQDLMMLIMNS
jgi:hypothetical protein